MEVTELSAEGLERKFTVKVPASELDAKLHAKLSDLKTKVQLKGFRKGKAPISFLRKMYGKGVMGEILQDLIAETSAKAFSDRDLRPATQPHPHFEGDMDAVVEGRADLEYVVHAEVLPDFEPIDVATLSLTRPIAEVPAADVQEALSNLAEQQRTFSPRPTGEAAQKGDAIVIDFKGSIDGKEFPGGAGEGVELVLGTGRFIPGFEDQLIGAKAGDDLSVNVTFPADYGAAELAGKDATFAVSAKEVKEPDDTVIDDAFAQKLGLENLADLEGRLRERLERDFRQLSRGHVKRNLLDQLDAAHKFDLPKSMVDAEFEQIWRQVETSERDEEDKDKSEEELRVEYRNIAARRVKLGLVLAEIGKRAQVVVPNEALQRAVQEQAMREAQFLQMQGQDITPRQVLQFYQQNPNAIAQIRAPLFEEQVVDFILERATVSDVSVTKETLLKDPDGAPIGE